MPDADDCLGSLARVEDALLVEPFAVQLPDGTIDTDGTVAEPPG